MPLFQNESEYETFHMKMSSACSFIFMQIKVLRLVLKQRYSEVMTSEYYSVFGKLHFFDTKFEGDRGKQRIRRNRLKTKKMLTMKFVFPLSPRQSCRSLVRVEFLYGTCLFCPRARA